MAGSRNKAAVPAVAMALLVLVLVASSSAVAGLKVCNVDRDSVVKSCRPYCAVGSTEEKPSEPCCAAVRGANFKCLCRYKDMLSADIDGDRAVQIPSQCGIPGAPTSCA